VHDLQPGTSYQFRVHKKNRDNVSSKHSEAVVVQTMLETPAAAVVIGQPGCTSIRLRWAAASMRGFGGNKQETQKGGRVQEATNKMLTEWTRADEDADGGLDLAHKFETYLAMYDVDNSGTLDREEFKELLRGLGVEPTDIRVNEAFAMLDTDNDGTLSFDEFEDWWTRDSLTYVLKRDDGYSEQQLLKEQQLTGGTDKNKNKKNSLPPRTFSTTCYRGSGKQIEVMGLQPNTLYHFRLRHASSTTDSFLSPPLEVMTAPQAPTKAGVVAQYAKTIDIKWHAKLGGADRYTVEMKMVETLPSAGDSGRKSSSKAFLKRTASEEEREREKERQEPAWVKAYEGTDTMTTLRDLKPNTVYRLRVQSVNRLGVRSEWSAVSQCYTVEREREPLLAPQTAVRMFTIECAHDEDVVPGDTILFTERIYIDPDTGRPILEGGKSTASGARAGGTASSSRGRGGFDPNLSVSSVGSRGGGGEAMGCEYLGTRTVAAKVVAESYITSKQREQARMEGRGLKPSHTNRITAGSSGVPLAKKHRELRLQVAWCTVEKKEAERFKLKKNANIERKERHLFRFETFRIRWKDDDARKMETWSE
jgi:hypothetical protein